MKVNVKITYEGPLDPEKDKTIMIAADREGMEWRAQGTDLETGIRDISFDWNLIHPGDGDAGED